MPKPPARNDVLSRLRSTAAIKGNQSSLYQWYVRHLREFSAIVDGVVRPGWDAITEELKAEGITKRGGQPLTASYVRQTWWKVRRAHNRKKTTAAVAAPPPRLAAPVAEPGEIAPGVRPASDVAAKLAQPGPAPISQEATALLANLRKQVDKRSGR